MRNTQSVVCKICGQSHSSIGLSSHLRSKHNIDTSDYIKLHGDFRLNSKRAVESNVGKEKFRCKLCNDNVDYTEVALSHHLRKIHSTTKEEYIIEQLLGGIRPVCGCGCGSPVKVTSYNEPHSLRFVAGHNKSTLGYTFSKESRSKMKVRACQKVERAKSMGTILPWHLPDVVKRRSEVIHAKSMESKARKHNITILEEANGKIRFKCNGCGEEFSQFHSSYFNCITCNPPKKSNVQLELFHFVKDVLGFQDVVLDHRKEFGGSMELDVYVPSKRIGIEFDGLYYHSQLAGGKEKSYHLWKTMECEKKGIRLVHVFEDEWRDKTELVKSKIQKILGVSAGVTKLFARKCTVREIDYTSTKTFLERNHIQGAAPASVNVGLFNGDLLLSVATFGKPTIVRGKKSMTNGEWELIRFCTALEYNVVGACGKLLSHFVKIRKPSKIVSYADKRFTDRNHNLYSTIGFTLVSESDPNYFYMKGHKDRLHRFNFTKQKLVSMGGDPSKTEWQLMQESGYDRIWDCGHFKFEKTF